jgi:hypothetical protein
MTDKIESAATMLSYQGFLWHERKVWYASCIHKVKESRNRAGVAQRVPVGLGSQISMTFGT